MKISKQRILMSVLVALFIVLVAITYNTPGQVEDITTYTPNVYATAWALLPPVIAIVLALLTKEVYSSLFVGILTGGLL